MSNIDHMLASIINKDEGGFASAFGEEMKERLATSIVDKDLNISQDLLSDDEEIDSEEQEEIEEVVKKGKPIEVDLLYPKGHPRAGEIVGGKKKTKPEESEKMKRYKAKWNPKNMKRNAVRTGMEKTESVEPLEERRGAKFFPSGYTFKTTKDAKEFVVALKHMGLRNNTVSIKGKTVSLSDKLDASTPANHDRLSFIKNLAKDMKASINENVVIGAIREAYISENGVIYTLKDLENIHILPKDAESIIQIHDNLNEDNQTILREMLSETEESYYKVLDFCNEKCSKEQ